MRGRGNQTGAAHDVRGDNENGNENENGMLEGLMRAGWYIGVKGLIEGG
jgi:hypothetical protein